MLTDLGYEVAGQAETALEAIAMARETKPDLILMDVLMPGGMNGIDAAREIKAELGTPIIFISGYGDPEYIEAAKKTAPFGYVMKPFDEKEVHAFVEIALSKRALELKLEKSYGRLERTNLDLQEEIAARKKTERALRESSEKFHSIVDNIGIGVSLISPKMEILEMNRQVCEWFPNVDSSTRSICYRAFNSPPRDEICDYCPTCKTKILWPSWDCVKHPRHDRTRCDPEYSCQYETVPRLGKHPPRSEIAAIAII